MKLPERVHPFQINKTAIAAPSIDCRMMLNNLGTQLNLSSILYSILGNWNHHFCCNWFHFNNLIILLFHEDSGVQANNTTTAAGFAILFPVTNGPMPACCKQHVRFVQVQMNLDFLSLVTLDSPGVTVLLVEFYIELPQGSPCQRHWRGIASHHISMSQRHSPHVCHRIFMQYSWRHSPRWSY
jgi:hypothetical protein